MLDVPVQGKVLFRGSRNVSSSSLESAVFTLDPKDKYLPPGVHRATTTSAVSARKARIPSTSRPMVRAPHNGSIEAEVAPQTSKTTQAVPTLERRRSLLSVFHRMRQTRSAGSNTKSSLVWPRKIFSRASQPTEQDAPGPFPEVVKLPDCAPSLPPTRNGDEFELPIQQNSTAGSTERALTAFTVNLTGQTHNNRPLERLPSIEHGQSALPNEREQGLEHGQATSSVRNSETSFLSSYHTPLEQLRDTLTYFAPTHADESNDIALSDHVGRLDLAPDAGDTLTDPTNMPHDPKPTVSNAVPLTETPGWLELDSYSLKPGYAESLASYATSANFSPCPASNATHSGPMSPCRLSQPETPVMSEIEDDFLLPLRDSESLTRMGRSTSSDLELLPTRPPSRSAPPHLPQPQGGSIQSSHTSTIGGLKSYSLPNHDHSILTIRKLPSITLKNTDGASSFPQQSSKQDLVHSWNDGSEHHMTALEELVDDLGYLGRVII